MPDLPDEKKIKNIFLPDKAILNLDLIMLNMTLTLLSKVLRTIFCKKKVVLVSHQPFLNNHISNFLNYITKNSFDFEMDIVSEDQYKKQKKSFKNCVVLEGNKTVKDPYNIIKQRKTEVER